LKELNKSYDCSVEDFSPENKDFISHSKQVLLQLTGLDVSPAVVSKF
jgi:hypothetical protein